MCAGHRPPPPWVVFDGDVSIVPPGACVLLPLHDWRNHLRQWRAHAARVGVVLSAVDDPAVLLADPDAPDAVMACPCVAPTVVARLLATLAARGRPGRPLLLPASVGALVGGVYPDPGADAAAATGDAPARIAA